MLIRMSAISKIDPEEAEKELIETIDWLNTNFKLNIKPSRIALYRKILSNIQNTNDFEDFHDYLHVGKELDELFRITRVMRESDFNLQEKLEHIVSGPTFRFNAKKDGEDPSRDYLHELSVASKFLQAGYQVDLSTDCDVTVKTKEVTIYIECKRLKSKNKIKDRTKYASDQVNKRIENHEGNTIPIGYIALDITDILEDKDNIYKYDSDQHFVKHSHDVLKKYSLRYREIIRDKLNPHTICVIFFAHRLGFIKTLENHEGSPINVGFMYAMSFERNLDDLSFNERILKSIV